jgi:parvulin-like peptidyl-prolyl isomerase
MAQIQRQVTVKMAKAISLLISVMLLFGCVRQIRNGDILAYVDGDPITTDDIAYSLQIEHRREDLSSARALDISRYLQRLINERLIVQESIRMGLDQNKGIQNSVNSFILSESVVLLYNNEIVGKVSISDKEIKSYYKRNFERFSLGIIETDSADKSEEISNMLKRGADFMELAGKYPARFPKNDDGMVIVTRKSLRPSLAQIISDLSPGETSGFIKSDGRYYMVQLFQRHVAPDIELEKHKKDIKKTLRKNKEDELSSQYLEQLREKASIQINNDILSSIKSGVWEDEKETWLNDKRTLAEANGYKLPVGAFISMIPPGLSKSYDQLLNNWINTKVVDHEAISRHYEAQPALRDRVVRYRNELLKRLFVNYVVKPEIIITEKDLQEYYADHQQDFLKPRRYKIQQITVQSLNEAQKALDSLLQSANFAWVAKQASIDSFAHAGGDRGWLTSKELPGSVRKIIDTLKPGDISPILKNNSHFTIIRLQERSGDEVKEFEAVKNDVHRAYSSEIFRDIYNKHVNRLAEEASIIINRDAVEAFEKTLTDK